MPLEPRGQGQDGSVAQQFGVGQTAPGSDQAGHHGGGRRTQSATVRHAVVTVQAQAWLRYAGVVEPGPNRPGDQMIFGQRDGTGTLTAHRDLDPGRSQGEPDDVMNPQRQPQTVESGSEIG